MMLSLPKYDCYKDSGVDWLGEIPSHWEVLKNKFLFKEQTKTVGKHSSNFTLLSLTLSGVIKRDMDNPQGKFPAEFNTYKIVEPQDIIFCLFDVEETPRTVGHADCQGMITGAYDIFKCESKLNSKYIYYYYLFLDFDKRLKPLYTGLRKVIKRDNFLGIKSPIPPIEEQEKIVKFLDKKCEEVERSIELKQRLITLLDEQKSIVINQAVTKGLNPHAPMKDSGIDWLGDIPAHWEVKKLKYVSKYNQFTLDENTDPNLEISYIDIGSVSQGNINKTENYLFKNAPSRARRKSKEGDTVISTVRTYLKAISYVDKNYSQCIFSTGFCILTPDAKIKNLFFTYWLQCNNFILEIIKNSEGVSYPAITPIKLSNIKILIPPIEEQEKIVKYLEQKTAEIEELKEKTLQQIEKLKEFKQILIAEAVTGKIKV